VVESGTSDIGEARTEGDARTAEAVYFAVKARADYRHSEAYPRAVDVSCRVWFTFISVAALLTGLFIHYVVRIAVAADDLAMVIVLMMMPAFVWRLVSRLGVRNFHIPTSSREQLPECRLRCVGLASKLTRYGGWADVSFPPAVFFSGFAVPGWRGFRWLLVGFVLLALVALLGIAFRCIPQPAMGLLFVIACIAVGIEEVVIAFFWPTYLRLVPGRLDVLGYSPLSRKPAFIDRYDLRDAKITADLRRTFVSIISPDGKLEFGISLMRQRKKFVYMLFLAAMSTHQPGPVPEDELLG
jgi:hypothetical protein